MPLRYRQPFRLCLSGLHCDNKWYNKVCAGGSCSTELAEITVSVVTECGWSEVNESAGEDDECAPDEGEIPMIDEELADLWEEEVCQKPDFQNNLCLQEIWNKMNELNVAFETLTNYTSDAPKVKLCLNVKSIASTKNAQSQLTGVTSSPTVNIDINSNELDRSKLSVAKTILHELIHAELLYWVAEAGGTAHFEEYAQNYSGTDPFKILLEYFKEHGQYISDSKPGWHHEYMADNYIQYMADGLKKLAPFLLSSSFRNYVDGSRFYTSSTEYVDWDWDEFYTGLAWVGLDLTSKWDDMDEITKRKYKGYVNQLKELEVSAAKCN